MMNNENCSDISLRYHDITTEDMKNGDGLRTVLWLAGCEHHCPEYRFAVVDKKLDKIVKERKYTIRDVKVHHVMPGYGTNFGKLTVKIQDEQENVYYQEFTLNRKMAKMYKNDTDTAFILIALDRNKNIYSLLSKKEEQKKEKSEEAAEE